MGLSAPDATVAAAKASVTSPAFPASSAANAAAPLAPQPEIQPPQALPRPRGRPRLINAAVDAQLREIMRDRGTRNARMIRERLARPPYSRLLSYEVVRRRVKQLAEEVPSPDPTALSTSFDAEGAGHEQLEEGNGEAEPQTVPTVAERSQSTQERRQKSKKKSSSAQARDLDMLAETVSYVVEPSTPSADDGEVVVEVSGAPKEVGGALQAEETAPGLKRGVEPVETPVKTSKRVKRAEYSEETRAQCVHRHQTDGASYAVIAKELGMPHDSVRAIVRKAKRTGSVSSAPRSGRPRKTSSLVDKVILQAVKNNECCSAKAIQEELDRVFQVKVSSETIRRRVLAHTKQRLLVISGGAESESEKESNAGTERSRDEAPVPVLLPAPDVAGARPEGGSFQQLLHEEEHSTTTSIPGVEAQLTATEAQVVAEASPLSTGVGAQEEQSLSCSLAATQRQKRGGYSLALREQCVTLHAQGHGYRRIGKTLSMPHTTVRAIVEKAQRTGSVLPAPRSGRPRKTDEIVDKVILQAVKTNQKSSARMIQEQLLEVYDVRVSCETIRRRVKDHSRQSLARTGVTTPADATATAEQQQRPMGPEELLAIAVAEPASLPTTC
ncbi:hypothetical protein BBJ28_00005744 [Nothophytophthora sp. Chile5]|nr:hypothetical protein BBJ28_00005744 [Nothophytophthora sp. Chile5]